MLGNIHKIMSVCAFRIITGKKESYFMKFTRIDKNTIRAIVTQEDMQEHGIKIEDFFKDQSKVQDFLRIIVEKASEEIGYESKQGIMSMQVTPLSQGSLCITFSENDESSIESMLRHIKDAIDGIEEMEETEDLTAETFAADQLMNAPKKDKTDADKKKKETPKQMLRIFRFQTLSQVETFCEAVPFEKMMKSDLVKDEREGGYYLILEKARLSVKNFNAVCEMATEFSKFVSDRPARAAYLKEHGTKMIEKKAISVLKNLGR